jgi:hypothetical protein
MSNGRRVYYWTNLVINPILFAMTLGLPWFITALKGLPEGVVVWIAWASVFLRLGWVILSIALNPERPHIVRLLFMGRGAGRGAGRRWLSVALVLFVLLVAMQAIVLMALAALWVDALQAIAFPSRRRNRSSHSGGYDQYVDVVFTRYTIEAQPKQGRSSDE